MVNDNAPPWQRRNFKFIAAIPVAEGRVSLCEFRGLIVVASEFGPARIISKLPDGRYEITIIKA